MNTSLMLLLLIVGHMFAKTLEEWDLHMEMVRAKRFDNKPPR